MITVEEQKSWMLSLKKNNYSSVRTGSTVPDWIKPSSFPELIGTESSVCNEAFCLDLFETPIIYIKRDFSIAYYNDFFKNIVNKPLIKGPIFNLFLDKDFVFLKNRLSSFFEEKDLKAVLGKEIYLKDFELKVVRIDKVFFNKKAGLLLFLEQSNKIVFPSQSNDETLLPKTVERLIADLWSISEFCQGQYELENAHKWKKVVKASSTLRCSLEVLNKYFKSRSKTFSVRSEENALFELLLNVKSLCESFIDEKVGIKFFCEKTTTFTGNSEAFVWGLFCILRWLSRELHVGELDLKICSSNLENTGCFDVIIMVFGDRVSQLVKRLQLISYFFLNLPVPDTLSDLDLLVSRELSRVLGAELRYEEKEKDKGLVLTIPQDLGMWVRDQR